VNGYSDSDDEELPRDNNVSSMSDIVGVPRSASSSFLSTPGHQTSLPESTAKYSKSTLATLLRPRAPDDFNVSDDPDLSDSDVAVVSRKGVEVPITARELLMNTAMSRLAPRTGTSSVWEHFRKWSKSEVELVGKSKLQVVCLRCLDNSEQVQLDRCVVTIAQDGSTGRMMSHLKHNHREIGKRKMDDAAQSTGGQSSIFSNMSAGQSPGPMDKHLVGAPNFQGLCMEWMIMTYTPFSALQNQYFQKMIYSLNSKAELMSKEKVVEGKFCVGVVV